MMHQRPTEDLRIEGRTCSRCRNEEPRIDASQGGG
jgi:hypothetical protein